MRLRAAEGFPRLGLQGDKVFGGCRSFMPYLCATIGIFLLGTSNAGKATAYLSLTRLHRSRISETLRVGKQLR